MRFWAFSKTKVYEMISSVLLLVKVLLGKLSELQNKLSKLQEENQILKEKLAQNSRNSHRPPSSDVPEKPKPKSLRQPSNRRPGGQSGHPGQTLHKIKDPDQIQIHPLKICPSCQGKGLGKVAPIDYEERQVFDLPRRLLEVTEHRAEIKCCPHCGQTVKAEFPAGVTAPAQYGLRFKSLMVYLNQQQFIPFDRLSQLSDDIFGLPLSPATVGDTANRLYAQLEPFEKEVINQLQHSKVVHLDETGLRLNGKVNWLHVACTATLTHYGVHPKRGSEAIEESGVLIGFCGCAVHDCYQPYFKNGDCLHGICNAHLLRELRFVWEEKGQKWAKKLSDLLLELKERKKAEGTFNRFEFEEACGRYRKLVKKGRRLNPIVAGQRAQSKTANLVSRLEGYEQYILAFLWHESIPFTNNQAERDLRMMKLRQKISGCFRTFKGAQIFCRIHSYLSTCRKNMVNVWEAIQMGISGTPFILSSQFSGP